MPENFLKRLLVVHRINYLVCSLVTLRPNKIKALPFVNLTPIGFPRLITHFTDLDGIVLP